MNTRCLLAAGLRRCCALLLLIAATLPVPAAIDVNNGGQGDGIPDVWAAIYNAGSLPPSGDADGDGHTNAVEALAGTNPRSPASTVRISDMLIDAAGLHLSYPTQAGKRYQVQSSGVLANPTWLDVGSDQAGSGADATAVVTTPGGTEKFYRVVVRDADSDGDGVNDWEELALGYDPNSSHSSGLSGLDDLSAITQALQAPNVVSIVASDPTAAEGGDPGAFIISRTGNIDPLTITYSVSGPAAPGTDYTALSGTITLPVNGKYATVTVSPLEDTRLESPEAVIVSINANAAFTTGTRVATVLIGDRMTANGSGLNAQFYNEASTLNPSGAVPPGVAPTWSTLRVSRIDPVVDYDWVGTTQGIGSPAPRPGVTEQSVNVDYFASRWTGEVMPEFSQIYTFELEANRCARMWINGQLVINKWPGNSDPGDNQSGNYTASVDLVGGVRYPIVVEHFETNGDAELHLRWRSVNTNGNVFQVIPTARLFPNTPPQIFSETEIQILKGSGPFTYQIRASGNPTSYAAANLPAGWTFNGTTGLISGSPSEAGVWEIPLIATNSFGSGSAVLRLEVISTGGGITREVWTGVAGDTVGDIPLGAAPASTGVVNSLQSPENDGDNFGARLRGFVTAPISGTYKFWITADQVAELWISDDEEAVNSFKRAEVISPTAYQAWSAPGAGKSPLLWLDAGKKYYIEVRHKESTGTDHVSVGWLKPGQGGADPANATAPSEVVPGYALTPWSEPTGAEQDGTLYTALMVPQGSAQTSAYGNATLRLSADETTAYVAATFSNLTSAFTGMHVHDDRLPLTSNIVFDPDEPGVERRQDGSYVWRIIPVAGLSTAQLVQGIKSGNAYFNIHSVNSPGGEIKGYFRLQTATTSFTPPPPAPAYSSDHTSRSAASRFLIQSTFGPAPSDLLASNAESVLNLGYEGWIDAQFAKPITQHYPFVFANRDQTDGQNSTYPGTLTFNSWWKHSVTAPDQLRQRVAFALSEIMVVSEAGPLDDRADTLSDYYDMLLEHSFGNVRDLLEAVTLHPAMGRYLDMLRNDKPDKNSGRIPNENYAREILQLFSIGLYRMWPDGSLMVTSKGELIPTYDQDAIMGFAHAFTGWDYFYTGAPRTALNAGANWIEPMREVPVRHFTGPKRILNNIVLPGLPMLNGRPLDPYGSHTATEYNQPAYQGLAAAELDATHDAIFNHPNTGPFICRQLIQRLVSSTPSRGYLYRVVQKFNDNGQGVRGDMKAIIKAILLDYEARSPALLTQQGFGKQREPVLRVSAVARAFPSPAPVAGTYTQTGSLIAVNTATPHLYGNGSSIFLDFQDSTGGDAGSPADAVYTVSNVTANGFQARTKSFESAAAFQQVGPGTRVVTDVRGFQLGTNENLYLEYITGTPTIPTSGVDVADYRSSDERTLYFAAPGGKVGSYSQTGNTVTVTSTAHGYAAGASIHVDFLTPTAAPIAGLYSISSVNVNGNSFSFVVADATSRTGTAAFIAAASALASTSGTVNVTRAGDFANRTGSLSVTYSDWNMDTTGTDLNQTPLRSPTVFNFFLPDYQYPGRLSEAGLVTPEFEITSDTSVIRQVNFLYSGLFNDAVGQTGWTSFKNNGRDILLDLKPWMGNPPTGHPGATSSLPWVHNNNLDAFITELNTRLMGGQLPASARTTIRNYVMTNTLSTTPTTAQLRDRVRSAIHLIITSPDFAIQK